MSIEEEWWQMCISVPEIKQLLKFFRKVDQKSVQNLLKKIDFYDESDQILSQTDPNCYLFHRYQPMKPAQLPHSQAFFTE
jgi:hypothetical protein